MNSTNIIQQPATVQAWLTQRGVTGLTKHHIARALGVSLSEANSLLSEAPTAKSLLNLNRLVQHKHLALVNRVWPNCPWLDFDSRHGAQQLHKEREAWLNPPGVSGKALEQRTLTNLYNALLVFRGDPPAEGKSHPKIVPATGDFAPRLAELHAVLDRAVCDAYGWEYALLDDEEEILRRLLALNLERAAGQ